MPAPAGTDPTLSTPSHIESIIIPGLLDVAVNDCTTWHLPRVSSKAFKENILRARDVALESCLGLKQISKTKILSFLSSKAVARRFVNDISHWVKRHGDENDRQS